MGMRILTVGNFCLFLAASPAASWSLNFLVKSGPSTNFSLARVWPANAFWTSAAVG
jgi:hypothetical protein